MSDGTNKLDEEGSPTDGTVKRAGRARICKQCRFTTTDVREFSAHRQQAHADENTDDKTVTRKNSLRRKSSTTTNPEDQKPKDQNTSSETKDKVVEKEQEVKESEQKVKKNTEEEMESEKISDELLNSLALAPRKQINDLKSENGLRIKQDKKQSAERFVMDKFNGHGDDMLIIKDEEQDDEPRLVIDDENGDNLDLGEPALCRSGNIQNRTYLCSLCDFSTTNAKSYLHHQKDEHNADIIIYECDICDYATKYKQKLPRHRKLHYTGKDSFTESDLDSSYNEKEFREMKEEMNASGAHADRMNGDDEMDDDGEIEEDEEEEMVALAGLPEEKIVQEAPEGAPVERKKRIRQEVDPLKYFEVMDDIGVKYACSKCGNVYKWRKSLNKHWKEKHFGETPDLTKPPPTLQNYTLFSRYKAKFGGQPPPPAAPNVVYGPASSGSRASPVSQQKSRVTPILMKSDENLSHLSNVVMPRQIGPFIAGTNQDVLSGAMASLASHMEKRGGAESKQEIRKMVEMHSRSSEQHEKSKYSSSQNEPLDFSKPLDFSRKPDVKSEPEGWNDTNSENDSLQEMPISMVMSQANSQIISAMKQSQQSGADGQDGQGLQCIKCSFVAKTLAEYSSHMSLHQNKKAFKCAECQSHFNGVEDLNKHFMETHSEKIQEHKEAIQKIPHGLQQTYHLLKMPLDSISNLSSQELLSNEPKQLKCSMCQFVAKWPAELQKHAVSHSEERPFVCMVCGSTYKWKWDLVKHFEKSHSTLPNPYKRREGGGVMASNSSPSTPPLEAISRSASALMDVSMSNYIMDDDSLSGSHGKKRRLSEVDSQDGEDFYREMLERQVRQRRELSESPNMNERLQMSNRSSDQSWKKNGESQRMDESMDYEGYDYQTPKKHVTEALKQRITFGKQQEEESKQKIDSKHSKAGSDVVLPYKCSVCEYRARWPSEISQHMKNHSSEKPYHCPRCSYKSKWKWDVVKHLRRCGGGTVHDVIDTTKMKKMAPPNVMVLPQNNVPQKHKTPQAQPVFPTSQRASSVSPVMSTSSSNAESGRVSTPNFSMATGGQDHPDSIDLSHSYYSDGENGKPVFRSLVNQGIYHCLECPFIGNNSAELRRHSVLHSENKPFMCNMCGYSSRWKCDLKKHMKLYGHFNSSAQDSSDDADTATEKYIELDDESDEENKSTLYMCPNCPYNSYKKQAFNHHLRIHGNLMDESSVSPTPSNESSSAKYKCSKCGYQGNDLSSFLQHKRSHNQSDGKTNNSPSPSSAMMSDHRNGTISSEVSNRTLHLKHRRKPVKQFKCEICPFVCFKRQALDNHDAMHLQRSSEAYLCMFCNYNVFSKNLLLQHMRLHPDYNPAECSEADTRVSTAELMEMEELEERELSEDTRKTTNIREENNNTDVYESGYEGQDGIIDFSKGPYGGRTSTPLSSKTMNNNNNNSMKASPSNNNNNNKSGLPCEWCSTTFPNLATLYQHAQSAHPIQLKAQEAGDIIVQQAPSKSSQLEKIVRERQKEYQVYHQFMSRQQPQIQQQIQNHLQSQSLARRYIPLAPKPQTQSSPQVSPGQNDGQSQSNPGQLSPNQLAAMRARKSASQQKKARSFQCTKCSFTAPNAVTYLRHIERHGSNCKHTCLYCDYSIDRLNLLYQHMKGTHGSKWQGTTEEKIILSVHSEDSNNNIIENMNVSEDNSEDLNASFGSSHNDSLEGEVELKSTSDGGALSAYSSKGIKPVLILREETNWRGTPVQICSLDGRKHYKCPHCFYINSNAANTTNHVRQHGLNKKYKCKDCDYSVDNFKHIQHHQETIHPKEPNFILMNAPQSSSILMDDFTGEGDNESMTEASGSQQNAGSSKPSSYICPKCPYKTTEKMKFQIHLERHSNEGKYECQLCDYSVDKYSFLRQHAKLHNRKFINSENQMEMGEDTEMSFEDYAAVNRNSNQNRQAEKVRFRCSVCPYFTLVKAEILKHRQNHVEKSPYACQMCSFSSDKTSELEEHVKFHQTREAKPAEQYHDVTLDPHNDSYKLIQQLSEEGRMEIAEDEDDEMMDEAGDDMDEYEEMGDLGDGVEDDDEEMALMEEELRDSIKDIEAEKGAERNLNAEGAFDSDIQFRNFKCKDCPYSSNSNTEFRKHCRLHGMNYKFKCDFCNYSLDRVNLISQHRKLHFQEPGFEPAPLIASLLNKDHEDYESSLAKAGNEVAYPPTESGAKNNTDESSEFNYLYQKSAGGSDDKTRYACNKCPYKCQALKSFKCHIQMHGLTRKYRCDYCDWSTNRLNLLYQHRKVHILEPGYDPSPGDIVFLNREFILDNDSNGGGVVGVAMVNYSETPFTSGELNQLQSQKASQGQKMYFCKLCPFKSESVNTYSYHKKLHCIQAQYSCSECSFSINNITSLKEHIKLHKKEREIMKSSASENVTRHKCPKCPYSSPNKNMLVNHTTLHSSGRQHNCDQCDFSCDQQSLLKLHTKVHLEGYSDSDSQEELELMMKRSPSVIGPQVFLNSSGMQDLDSDSNEEVKQEHKCDKCPFSTPSKDELGNHSEHHSSQNKNTCMYCTFSCGKDDELLDHVQVHFPATKVDKDMLKLLKRQSNSSKRNISKTMGDADVKKEDVEGKSSDNNGEPDSTVEESMKEESTQKGSDHQEKTETVKESEKTKVYVCQYCEREFDSKPTMLQHEKQHLVGSQF